VDGGKHLCATGVFAKGIEKQMQMTFAELIVEGVLPQVCTAQMTDKSITTFVNLELTV